MNTPIYDYLMSYAKSEILRMHMPGHKGYKSDNLLSQIYSLDITEITGAGNLFENEGIISESEKNATELFGTKATFYSTSGSTLCIQAMMAIMKFENRQVFAVRNAHRSFLSACSLLGIEPEWIYPHYNDTIISGIIDFNEVEKAISNTDNACLYITSPDYLGAMADIKTLSDICHKYDAVLIVDNAHGACLPFYQNNYHPIALGADLCCDSAHKMLPALTGAAYLHIGNERYISVAKEAMLMFASTSPSYLIMCSLDLCNRFISDKIRPLLINSEKYCSELRNKISDKFCCEYFAFAREPLHFTINMSESGIDGSYFANYLRKNGIEYEFADSVYNVMLFSPMDKSEVYEKVYDTIRKMKFQPLYKKTEKIYFPVPEKCMSIREAAFSPHEDIPIDKAEGRICASVNVPCPPAVPVVVSGEMVTKESIDILKRFGIENIKVVKI